MANDQYARLAGGGQIIFGQTSKVFVSTLFDQGATKPTKILTLASAIALDATSITVSAGISDILYEGTPLPFAVTYSALTVSNKAVLSNVATLTTSAAHGLTTGQTVTISGLTPSALNGTFVVTVLTTTTFSYSVTTADISSTASTGSVQPAAGVKTVYVSTQTAANATTIPIKASKVVVASASVATLIAWIPLFSYKTINTGSTYQIIQDQNASMLRMEKAVSGLDGTGSISGAEVRNDPGLTVIRGGRNAAQQLVVLSLNPAGDGGEYATVFADLSTARSQAAANQSTINLTVDGGWFDFVIAA